MKVSATTIAVLLVLSGNAMAKDANTNSVTQQNVKPPSPPTDTKATVISHSVSARLPIASPRVGPNSTGVINSTSFDEGVAR